MAVSGFFLPFSEMLGNENENYLCKNLLNFCWVQSETVQVHINLKIASSSLAFKECTFISIAPIISNLVMSHRLSKETNPVDCCNLHKAIAQVDTNLYEGQLTNPLSDGNCFMNAST